MKHLFIVFLLITSISFAQTQNNYKHSLKGIKKVKIASNTSVKVVSTSNSQLVLEDLSRQERKKTFSKFSDDDHDFDDDCFSCEDEEHSKHKKKKQDKRKGLTAIYPGGKDNTNGLGFSIKKEGNTLIVKDLKSHFKRKGVKISLPKNIDINVNGGNLGNVFVNGFSSEVEAKTNVGKIIMNDVTGPITANGNVGVININFSKVSQTSPITITSSVSEIDVTLPANTKASLDMKTNGTVYTNFDLKAEPKDGLQNLSSKKITGDINNGGVKIKLKSSMGNIYLRKK